jgi:hypothetical protein
VTVLLSQKYEAGGDMTLKLSPSTVPTQGVQQTNKAQ